jgi:hypothetical protein
MSSDMVCSCVLYFTLSSWQHVHDPLHVETQADTNLNM